jgi:hypothetical protein
MSHPRRKSTGGKAPRKVVRPTESKRYLDHAGREYTVVGGQWGVGSSTKRKLGIQLYCLEEPSPSPELLGDALLHADSLFADIVYMYDHYPRIDLYTGFDTTQECIEHHRLEKAFRKRAIEDYRREAVAGLRDEAALATLATKVRGKEPLPHIVPSWCRSAAFWRDEYWYEETDRYRSWIFVMPKGCRSWNDAVEKGIFEVKFDRDITIDMHTTLEEDFLDSRLEGEEDWINVSLTGLHECPEVRSRLLCARMPPENQFHSPGEAGRLSEPPQPLWMTPGSVETLGKAWAASISLLPQCCYGNTACYECDDGEPHEECEKELDEHFFDEDGLCINDRREGMYSSINA